MKPDTKQRAGINRSAIFFLVLGIGFAAAAYIFWNSSAEGPKPSQTTTGSHSPILTASNISYTDMTINQATPDLLKQQLQRLCQDLNQLESDCRNCITNQGGLLELPSRGQLDSIWQQNYRPRIVDLLTQLNNRGIKSKLQDGVGTAETTQYIGQVATEICRLSDEN